MGKLLTLSVSAKKILFLFCLGLLATFMLANILKVHATGNVVLSLQPSTTSPNVGDTFTVNIVLNTNGDQVTAVESDLTFDPSKVQVQAVTQGSLLTETLDNPKFDNTAGTAQLIVGSGNPNVHPAAQGTGTVGTVTFKVVKSGSSTINFGSATQTTSLGKIGVNTVGTMSGTTITVPGGTTSTPVPTTVPVSTPVPTIAPTPVPTPTPMANIVSLGMSPVTVSTTVGSTFSVALMMDTSTDKVSAAELHITFDKTKLQAQSVTSGSFLPNVLSTGSVDNGNGTVSITVGANPTAPASGTGTLATVVFKALASGVTSISYDPSTQTASIGKTGNFGKG